MSNWALDILDMSWVEHTTEEVDFVIEALQLQGHERILDLACGFGRHSLELARRGYPVVGVDVTPDYIKYGQARASEEGLDVEFICSDALDVTFRDEFDVVLSMADGAIGYFKREEDNLKLFDIIAAALKMGGKHIMGVCSADHAIKHFPMRCWDAGSRSVSLSDFRWNASTSRMSYRGHVLKFGQVLEPISNDFPEGGNCEIRLYSLEELKEILHQRGMNITMSYGAYDSAIPASEDQFMQVVCSWKDRESIY